MKKLLFVFVMVMAVLVVKAQETKTAPSSTEKKVESTTKAATDAAAKVANLPKAVLDNIEKAYPGYVVKDVKAEKDGAEYKVMIEKGDSKETLLYDKDGKLLKSSSKSEGKEEKK